jgi:L-alanine-DL-glutamate epimerase-like enolase superfamily enzyme
VKITELRTTVVGAPWRELTFVELVTDEGLTGVGGVRLDHDACRAHPPTGARLELFREGRETRRGGR